MYYYISEERLRELIEAEARLNSLEYCSAIDVCTALEVSHDYFKVMRVDSFEEIVDEELENYTIVDED